MYVRIRGRGIICACVYSIQVIMGPVELIKKSKSKTSLVLHLIMARSREKVRRIINGH
jgi:hypothetical protein